MSNQHDRSAADNDRFFIDPAGFEPAGFDLPMGPEPECFSARRIVTIASQGLQPEDRLHMTDCDTCMTALLRYLQAQRKFAVYMPEPSTCTAKAARVSVELFGASELVLALDTSTLQLAGGVVGVKPRLTNRESNLLALTFEQAHVPKEIQQELAIYLELVKPVTITGMLRGGSTLESNGEIVLRNQAAAAR
jgi:hypothetical protein